MGMCSHVYRCACLWKAEDNLKYYFPDIDPHLFFEMGYHTGDIYQGGWAGWAASPSDLPISAFLILVLQTCHHTQIFFIFMGSGNLSLPHTTR